MMVTGLHIVMVHYCAATKEKFAVNIRLLIIDFVALFLHAFVSADFKQETEEVGLENCFRVLSPQFCSVAHLPIIRKGTDSRGRHSRECAQLHLIRKIRSAGGRRRDSVYRMGRVEAAHSDVVLDRFAEGGTVWGGRRLNISVTEVRRLIEFGVIMETGGAAFRYPGS